jgi:hypothetical protein
MAASPSAITLCAGCGRQRPCYHPRSERPLCNSCYRRENIKRWNIAEWTKPVGVCARCSAEGPAWFARTDHPLCDSCHSRARQRLAPAPGTSMACPGCGQARLCWNTLADGMLCRTCARRRYTRLAQPPVMICAVCGQRQPCHFAKTDRPVCLRCRWHELHPPRFPPGRPCSTCGQKRKLNLRLGDLCECESCNQKRLRSKTVCAGCGEMRRPSLGDRERCERCVGEPIRHVCRECGAEERNHTDGRCARCTLIEVLRQLRADGDPYAVARLEPYLRALGTGPQPATTLKWMGYSAGYETVVELATGARELSHQALDQVNRGMTTSFLRAALVTHGVLEARGEQTARFERGAASAVRGLAAGEDRTQIRAFSVWQVQHNLARRERQGRTTAKSGVSSLQLVRAAVELSTWTTDQGLTLAQLRQEHLDRWLQEGSSATAKIRPFLTWATRGRLIAPFTASRPPARTHIEPMSSEERLIVVRRLLRDETLDPRDRVAGCLVLIYAQPVSRILALTIDDVWIHPDRVSLSLGPARVELPEPLAHLAARLAGDPAGRATTAVAGAQPRWLFQGMRVGQQLDYGYLQRRLKRLGIKPLQGRTGAVITLAAALPPTLLAEMLGISETSASKWYRLAAGEWNRYAASVSSR